MAEELPVARRANILAEGLGISPTTYAGMESEALDAMTAIQAYRFMQPWQKAAVLPSIHKTFFATRPAFFYAAQSTLAMEVANPQWVPASMTNEEVYSEAVGWDRMAWVVKLAGGGGTLTTVVGGQVKAAGSAAASAAPGMFWSTFFGKIKMISPPAIFLAGLQSLTGGSQDYWRMEMKRRLQSGQMLPEDIRRNYGDLK